MGSIKQRYLVFSSSISDVTFDRRMVAIDPIRPLRRTLSIPEI